MTKKQGNVRVRNKRYTDLAAKCPTQKHGNLTMKQRTFDQRQVETYQSSWGLNQHGKSTMRVRYLISKKVVFDSKTDFFWVHAKVTLRINIFCTLAPWSWTLTQYMRQAYPSTVVASKNGFARTTTAWVTNPLASHCWAARLPRVTEMLLRGYSFEIAWIVGHKKVLNDLCQVVSRFWNDSMSHPKCGQTSWTDLSWSIHHSKFKSPSLISLNCFSLR